MYSHITTYRRQICFVQTNVCLHLRFCMLQHLLTHMVTYSIMQLRVHDYKKVIDKRCFYIFSLHSVYGHNTCSIHCGKCSCLCPKNACLQVVRNSTKYIWGHTVYMFLLFIKISSYFQRWQNKHFVYTHFPIYLHNKKNIWCHMQVFCFENNVLVEKIDVDNFIKQQKKGINMLLGSGCKVDIDQAVENEIKL